MRRPFVKNQFSDNIWNVLACPCCCRRLVRNGDDGALCAHCQTAYAYTDSGSLDLRLKKQRTYGLQFQLGVHLPPDDLTTFGPLRTHPSPEVAFSGIKVPYHLTAEILSHFPKARGKGSLVLDLGCGDAIHRTVCEYAGFEYAGLDYDSSGAPFLGDAHALPFADSSFEFILSIAVLEHIRFPFVMMREAHRVLQPGGHFIGTVAFLEPFHLDSYYHHSHLGTLNSLQYAGFKAHQIAPHEEWTVLKAQAVMALFPGMPRRFSEMLVVPLQAFHRLWWQARRLKNPKLDLNERIRNTSGSFAFIATR